MIVNGLYDNPESMTEKELHKNPAVESLLHFYRVKIGI